MPWGPVVVGLSQSFVSMDRSIAEIEATLDQVAPGWEKRDTGTTVEWRSYVRYSESKTRLAKLSQKILVTVELAPAPGIADEGVFISFHGKGGDDLGKGSQRGMERVRSALATRLTLNNVPDEYSHMSANELSGRLQFGLQMKTIDELVSKYSEEKVRDNDPESYALWRRTKDGGGSPGL